MWFMGGGGMSMRQLHGCRRYMVLEVNKSFIWARFGIRMQHIQSSLTVTNADNLFTWIKLKSFGGGRKGFR